MSGGWGDLFAEGSRPQEVLEALDEDGDGFLDATELEAFAERGGASLDDYRSALRRLRRGLAKWLDSPCAGLQLRSVAALGPPDASDAALRGRHIYDGLTGAAKGTSRAARRDLAALNLGLRPRDLDLGALAFARRRAPLAPSVARFADETARFLARAKSTRGAFAKIASYAQLARVLDALSKLPRGWARKDVVSQGAWDAHCVPALRGAGLGPTDVDAVVKCLAEKDGSVRVASLDALADSEPLARALDRPKRKPSAQSTPKRPQTDLRRGDAVAVAANAAKRFLRASGPVPGVVVALRPNGRYDVQPDDETLPTLAGLRRVDLALRDRGPGGPGPRAGDAKATPPRPPTVRSHAAPPDTYRGLGGGAAGPSVPDAAPPKPTTRRYIAPTSTIRIE